MEYQCLTEPESPGVLPHVPFHSHCHLLAYPSCEPQDPLSLGVFLWSYNSFIEIVLYSIGNPNKAVSYKMSFRECWDFGPYSSLSFHSYIISKNKLSSENLHKLFLVYQFMTTKCPCILNSTGGPDVTSEQNPSFCQRNAWLISHLNPPLQIRVQTLILIRTALCKWYRDLS